MTVVAQKGVFRRRLSAVAQDGHVVAAVEDDYHHMEIVVGHDADVVTSLEGRMIRRPWTSCSGAIELLPDLVGLPVSARCWTLPPAFAAKQHCTHLLDTALLAIAQAARGGERHYEFRIPNRIDGATKPVVIRDGRAAAVLEIDRDMILSPPPFAGRNTRQIVSWAEATLDDDTLEWLLILRRVMLVSQGVGGPDRPRAPMAEVLPVMAGACFTFQPGHDDAVPEQNLLPVSDNPALFSVLA